MKSADAIRPPPSLSLHLIPPIAAPGGKRSLVQMGLRRYWDQQEKGGKVHTNRNMWLVS